MRSVDEEAQRFDVIKQLGLMASISHKVDRRSKEAFYQSCVP